MRKYHAPDSKGVSWRLVGFVEERPSDISDTVPEE